MDVHAAPKLAAANMNPTAIAQPLLPEQPPRLAEGEKASAATTNCAVGAVSSAVSARVIAAANSAGCCLNPSDAAGPRGCSKATGRIAVS